MAAPGTFAHGVLDLWRLHSGNGQRLSRNKHWSSVSQASC